ncbi:SdpI family protein [Anaerococcus sp. Marseille-Q5996]|uniref:SdpI family protein n=1 Tax=Anaerococcus sp. Marseille-Q5996 TaxID=2972769 RepID=UPI0029170244|nr:SdpI family protein [Anaerococcus sp. Marseille-Q5996]
MEVGFHLWEVCYNQDTWNYGNKFAGNLSIILGILFFGIIYPICLYLELKRSYMTGLLFILAILFLLLLFLIVKIRMRKKFNLKDK